MSLSILSKDEDFQKLDKEEQDLICGLSCKQATSDDIEENLILLFQYQSDKFKEPNTTCDLISQFILNPDTRSKISDTVEKMAKNGNDIIKDIVSLSQNTNLFFVSPTTKRYINENQPA